MAAMNAVRRSITDDLLSTKKVTVVTIKKKTHQQIMRLILGRNKTKAYSSKA